MQVDPEVLPKLGMGFLGAAVSWMATRSGGLRGISIVLTGMAISYYGSDWLATIVKVPEGIAGFLLGLFSGIFAIKAVGSWDALDLTSIVRQWVRKRLGLPDEIGK